MRVYLIASRGEALPDAPSSLVATAVSSSRIDITWTNNATSYDGTKIERSTDGVNFTEIATVGSGVSTYANTGLSSGTQYYYRVRAYKGALNSAYSNTADATTSAIITERIIQIDTTKTESGSSASNQFRLAYLSNALTNFTVDWGDSTMDTVSGVGSSILHTYAVSGLYDIKISGLITNFVANQTSADKLKYIDVKNWGTVTHHGTTAGGFYGCRNMNVSATDAFLFNTNATTIQMFRDCRALTGNFSSWTHAFRDCREMFQDCSVFNGNVTTWNMSNCIDTSGMFYGARRFNQNISSWNVANVTNMSQMFRGIGTTGTSRHDFNQDISSWNVSKVTNMSFMFDACNFNQPIGTWDVSKVTTMSAMFRDASFFNQNLSSWNVSNVTDMGNVFNGAVAYNQDMSTWNVGKVVSFSSIFFSGQSFGTSAMVNNSSVKLWNPGSALTSTQTFNMSRAMAISSFQNVVGLSVSGGNDFTGYNMIRCSDISNLFQSGESNYNYGVWDIRNVTTALNFMQNATTVKLSATNLADTYIGWSLLPVRPLTISFGSAKYDASGASARAILTAPRAVSVTGAIDPNANGTYTHNGTRYQNANGFYFNHVGGQWKLFSSTNVNQAETTGSFPIQNDVNPMTGQGWTGANSGIVLTLVGAGWTITDGGQL
jgi:surface protein